MSVPLSERQVYSQSFEGLFLRGLEGQVTKRLMDRLRDEAHLDLGRPLEPSYPTSVWDAAIRITAEELFPELPREAAWKHIGVLFTRGYFKTLVGAAVGAVLRLLGPLRAARRLERSLRSGNNYSETSFHEMGPGHVEIHTNETGNLRHSLCGIILGGLEAAGAPNPRCTVVRFDADTCDYALEWDA